MCKWRSPVDGLVYKRSYKHDVSMPLVAHASEDAHKQNLQALLQQQPTISLNSGQNLRDNENNFGCEDEDDDLLCGDGDLSAILPAPSRPTISDVYNDVDQSPAGTLKVISSIQNDKLKQYILLEDKEQARGSRSIVTGAFTTSRSMPSAAASLATTDGAFLLNTYTQLYLNLSVQDRKSFAWLSDVLLNMPRDQEGPTLGPIHVPRNHEEADKVCITSLASVLKSTPVPSMQVITNGDEEHVVVDPLDTLHYFCAITPKNTFDSTAVITASMKDPDDAPDIVSSYFDSRAFSKQMASSIADMRSSRMASSSLTAPSQDINVSAALFTSFKLWSDGWDPDGIKNNRNGVWSLVWTIMIGSGPEFVFPLAVGPKSADHGPALRFVLDRIRSAGDYVTVRHLSAGKNVRIRLDLALYNVDRLERGELWGGLNHSSNRGKCHGVVSGFPGDKCCDGLRRQAACDACLKQLVRVMLNPDLPQVSPVCSQCACYDPVPDNGCTNGPIPSTLLEAKFVPYHGNKQSWVTMVADQSSWGCLVGADPSQPPSERPVKDVASYGPVRVSQEFMVGAAQFITYQCWRGAVKTKKAFKAWGDVCGWSDKTWRTLYDAATKHRTEGTEDFEDVFLRELLPPTWTDPALSIDKFLDAPMHLLFLGIVKKLVEMVEDWLSIHSLKASFTTFASSACDSLGKLGLQYLRAIKYGVSVLSRGSWVSEQYVAFSKTMILLHAGLLFTIHEEKRPDSEVKTVLRAIDACFCCVSLLMQRTVTEASVARAAISIKFYLATSDALELLVHQLTTKRTAKVAAQKKARAQKRAAEGTASEAQATPPTSRRRTGLVNGATADPSADESSEALARPPAAQMGTGLINGATDDQSVNQSSEALAVAPTAQRPTNLNAEASANPSVQSLEHPTATMAEQGSETIATITAAVGTTPPQVRLKRIPASVSVPNHASFQNIIRSMRSHGPPVDQWEGSEGGEKTIQSIKPYIHGVCIVQGGLLLAAMTRYYQNRVLSDINKKLAPNLSTLKVKVETKPRNRLTSAKRYNDRTEIQQLIDARGELTGFLFECLTTKEQAVVCEVKGTGGISHTYLRLRLSPTTPFGQDLLYFAQVSMDEEALYTASDSCVLSTKLVLVPGTYRWCDSRYQTGISALDQFDHLYTIIADDYRVLAIDGGISIKTPSASLWSD